MTCAEPVECANLVVTTSQGHSQPCANPFCKVIIEPLNHGRYRRTPRRFCSDSCRYDFHALLRVQRLMDKVGVIQFHVLLSKI